MSTHARRPVATAALLLAIGSQVPAQGKLPELSSLKPSTAPAFVLLGASPSAIERPTTPADFALMLANRAEQFSTVPKEFATEVAPYWMGSRPQLSWTADTARTIGQSIARTFTFSAANASIGTKTLPRTGLAAGARMMLLSGRLSETSKQTLRNLEASLAEEGAIFNRMRAAPLQEIDDSLTARLRAAQQLDPAQRAEAMARALERKKAETDALTAKVLASPAFLDSIAEGRKRFTNVALNREGPMLELAGAAGWGFDNAVWRTGKFDRWGAWATFTWARGTAHDDGAKIAPILVARFIANDSDTLPNFFDAGARLVVHDDRYGASLETVVRKPVGSSGKTLYRVAGVLEYQLRKDSWAIATFGRDHNTSVEGSLIAQLGLRLQFADERYK